MYRHVFWDLGGTLVDTYPLLDATLADVARRNGHEVEPERVSRLTRQSTGEAIRAMSEHFKIPAEEFEAANDALKRRWKTDPPPVMPGARELMDDLRAAGGLNIVVTHRDRPSAESLLDGLGLVPDDLISTSDGYPRKPDPTMYTVMLQRHGLVAEHCLGVGDRPIDAESARGAGLHAAMLTSPHAEPTDAAQHTISVLDDLRPLLQLGVHA